MAKTSLTVSMHVEGVRDTLAAFRDLPKDASTQLREQTLKLTSTLAERARAEGMTDAAPQSPLVASTVKAVKDRAPVITVGGTKRLGRNKKPAYKLLFGSVFGSNRYAQFGRPHRGRESYWFFDLVETEAPTIGRAWQRVANAIVRDFSEGG